MTDAPVPRCGLYHPDTYQASESVGYLIKVLYHSLQRNIDQRMQEHELTAMQWGPLLLLAKGKGDTAAELARDMGTDTGAMTRMLDRLQAKGLIQRRRSEEDRRVVHLELTPAGHEVVSRIPPGLCSAMNEHLSGFTAEELEQLKSLLRRMIASGLAVAHNEQPKA